MEPRRLRARSRGTIHARSNKPASACSQPECYPFTVPAIRHSRTVGTGSSLGDDPTGAYSSVAAVAHTSSTQRFFNSHCVIPMMTRW